MSAAAYAVVFVSDSVYLSYIAVLVESALIPDGTQRLTPVYQTRYIEQCDETVRREVAFGHMQMA